MKSQQQDFPHPYLAKGRNDYVEGSSFTMALEEQQIEGDSFRFCFRYTLNCAGIQNLLDSGAVKVILRIKSPSASYRTMHDFNIHTRKCTVTIPKQAVTKSIYAQGFLVVANEIKGFSLPELNQVYFHGISFALRKGDILGESDEFEIMLDDSELQKPLSSIFEIQCQEEFPETITPNFGGEKIRILLSQRLYDIYFNLRKRGEFRRFLSAVIIVPALVEALSLMQAGPREDGIDIEHKRWYRAINAKLPSVNVDDITEPGIPLTTIANRLLGDISWEALNSLKTTIDSINQASETIESEMRD